MTVDPRIAAAQKAAQAVERAYGLKSASTGLSAHQTNVVPTGSLLWDYQSGIGGHPMGAFSECFGPPSIGKTTIAGFGALRAAQEQGMLTGVIAVEPDVDETWMQRHGVNLEYNVLARPDNGEEAFGILHDWVYGGVVDFIVFDSIGGIASQKEQDADVPQAYGNSAMITWGVKRVVARAWKNNVGVLFINQQRDDTKARIAGLVDSPGGWAFKHAMKVRTHLKPGKTQFKGKYHDGVESKDRLIGREVIASFKKNKASESLGKSARFDFYHVETPDHPFGIDVGKDILAAAQVSGVFEPAGAWLKHPMFPKGKLNGKAAVTDWVLSHPERLPEIRNEVIAVMQRETAKKAEAKKRAELKVVGDE